MTKRYCNTEKKQSNKGMFIVVAIAVLVLASGCSVGRMFKKTTQKVVEDIRTEEKTYTKMVGYFPFETHTLDKETDKETDKKTDKKTEGSQGFVAMLDQAIARKCKGVIFVKAGDKNYPDFANAIADVNSPTSSGLDRAKRLKPLGYNAVMKGIFVALGIHRKMHGYFYWKESYSYLDMQLIVTVLDVETGSKLLEKAITRTVKLGKTDELELELSHDEPSRFMESAVFQKEIKKLTRDVGKLVCETVQNHPWRGHIRSVESDGTVIISSGQAVGISVGDQLAVIDLSRTIKSYQNERFLVPGVEIGRVSVISILPHQAKAKIIEGKNITAGSALKPIALKKKFF